MANRARPIGCCAFGSLVRTMVKAIGISTPPANPCKPRARIIEPRSWVKAQAIEKIGNSTALTSMIAAEREHPAQIIRQRNDDDLADQIGGRDPGAVVDAGADAAFDVEQRGVGDLDVEDRHEGADHAGHDRDPGRQAGLVGGAGRGLWADWIEAGHGCVLRTARNGQLASARRVRQLRRRRRGCRWSG